VAMDAWVNRSAVAVGVAALTLAMMVGARPAAAQSYSGPCAGTVAEKLAELGISQSDVGAAFSVDQRETTERGRTVGYDVWVDLRSCPGVVVLNVDRACRVRSIYTRGGCSFPGVPSF